MQFHVGCFVYRLRITDPEDGPLTDEEGREVGGLCVWETQEILISGTVLPFKRNEILLHELWHAWVWHLGQPETEEALCDNRTTFMLTYQREFRRQGGEAALMRLTPDGLLDSSVSMIAAAPTGAECARCSTRFSSQQIIDEPAVFDPPSGLLLIRRSIYCEFCGHVQQWREAATESGLPTGRVMSQPVFVTGQEANEFLRAHSSQLPVFMD